MKKTLLIIAIFILSLIQAPAYANDCNIGYAYNKMPYKSKITYKVVFVKYADSQNYSHKYLLNMVDFKETARYIKKESKNRANVKFDIVKKTFTIGNFSEYPMGFHGIQNWKEVENKFFSDVIAVTDPYVDYSNSDGVIIINDNNFFSLAVGLHDPQIADGRSLYGIGFSYPEPYLLAHEIMHNLGLKDLYIFEGHTSPLGNYSLMSIGDYDNRLLKYEKYSIGWLKDNENICHINGYTKANLSKPKKGTKDVMLSIKISQTEVIAIESRKSGVLVYYVNSSIPGGRGPISILGNLKPNSSLSYNNITIKHLNNSIVEVYN